MSNYKLPDLTYDYGSLEPHISGKIMELHHSKHHAAYVAGINGALAALEEAREKNDFGNINKLQKDLAFHLGGHINHSIFWKNLSPDSEGRPEGELAAAITEFFGSFEAFQAHFNATALGIQGSGWAFLAWDSLDHPSIDARHVGARLLPRLLERQGRLREGLLEHRVLERRADPL